MEQSGKGMLRGAVVYMFAFDIAYEFGPVPVTQLMGRPVQQFAIDTTKRAPRHPFFFRPLMVTLPTCERNSAHGLLKLERTVKLLPIGAISISVRVPFVAESLDQLVDFHDLHFGERSLYEEIYQVANEIRAELRPYLVRPMEQLVDEEAYTVFCVESDSLFANQSANGEAWLTENRRRVACLLTQESDMQTLSEQEALESTSRFLSYYETDLVVIDWDAALLIDEPSDFNEGLYMMELANLHLAELEAYDRILDAALERSYRDLRSRAFRRRAEMLYALREIRIDLARYNDELSNITKFFGDWHLARIYETLASRFHLKDWHRNVHEKLRTLDNLYQLLQQDQNNRWMLILEVTIVLLFIIDLLVLALRLEK